MGYAQQIVDDIYEQGFYISDNFLNPHDFQNLAATAMSLYSNEQFKTAKIGRQQAATLNGEIRQDEIYWLERSKDQAINTYLNKMDEIAKILNHSLFLGLFDFESHFAIYQPGSFYKKHIDQFTSTNDRRISCVYYLNETWEEAYGGELKLYDKNENLLSSILPVGNRFICFQSDLPHEVCTTQQTRYSIAGWMKARSLK
ncbi:2OG-Fe(II) oxygenase [Legionella lansingensis]|uniref:2OG-Fe(II) oxygenase n=1 Tax=Legionella lansingensis TaxID=45067 RepID=A0A0W0VPM7_9GAMM|nr:2OG-Fe(II) oxygenase [Legionella lansingensis]KTD22101.1 2OG-Fe(II) oxygenase [Legionella lansingensis]SNV45794.1 2OG-Fe(II) oxygenase [Legionella lansingensis]